MLPASHHYSIPTQRICMRWQVSWEIGEESYRLLKEEAGDSMEVEVIPGMGHEVWPPELSTVKAFLLRCLPSQEP